MPPARKVHGNLAQQQAATDADARKSPRVYRIHTWTPDGWSLETVSAATMAAALQDADASDASRVWVDAWIHPP